MTRKTFPSLLGLFAVVLAMVAIGLLVACGGGSIPTDVATVRAYTDANGIPTADENSLGFTYGPVDSDGAKYGADGFNCLINAMLVGDPDPDRIVRPSNGSTTRRGGRCSSDDPLARQRRRGVAHRAKRRARDVAPAGHRPGVCSTVTISQGHRLSRGGGEAGGLR